MVKKGGLGRGFESLIPTDLLDESFDPTAEQDEQVSDLRQIKLSEITADPDQPRRFFDEEALAELAASIKEHGVLQPIVVTPHADGYQIVAGERRFRASTLAGLDKIPALVRTLSGQHKLELSLIENLQRRDLNAIETATAYAKLRDQFNLSLEQIGQRVGGKSVSAISNTLRLLRLAPEARAAVADGKLTEGQARPLVGVDEALQELSASIREHGVLQPIVVTPAKDKSGYQIVAGERRYRASKLAGLEKIPALVRTLSDQHKLELSLIENIQRRDLNPLETATAYLKLRDQFNLSLEQIGKRVGGKSMSAISNTLRLLKLPKNARQLIAEGKITEGQARPLIGLDENLVDEILARIVKEGLSARAIEQLIVDLKGGAKKPIAKHATGAVNAHETEVSHFAERFNAKVKIRTNAKGAGQLIIPFKNDQDFERIKNLLG